MQFLRNVADLQIWSLDTLEDGRLVQCRRMTLCLCTDNFVSGKPAGRL